MTEGIGKKESDEGTERERMLSLLSPFYSYLTSLVSLSLSLSLLPLTVACSSYGSSTLSCLYLQSLLSLYPPFTFTFRLWMFLYAQLTFTFSLCCTSPLSSPSVLASAVLLPSSHPNPQFLLFFYSLLTSYLQPLVFLYPPLTFTFSPFCFCAILSPSHSVSAVPLVSPNPHLQSLFSLPFFPTLSDGFSSLSLRCALNSPSLWSLVFLWPLHSCSCLACLSSSPYGLSHLPSVSLCSISVSPLVDLSPSPTLCISHLALHSPTAPLPPASLSVPCLSLSVWLFAPLHISVFLLALPSTLLFISSSSFFAPSIRCYYLFIVPWPHLWFLFTAWFFSSLLPSSRPARFSPSFSLRQPFPLLLPFTLVTITFPFLSLSPPPLH